MPRVVPILCTAVLAVSAVSAPRADKLVAFHNGRVMVAQEIRQEDGWSYLLLGKGSEIGVPLALIASITEVEKGTKAAVPNVQAAAGGGGSTPTGRAPVDSSRSVSVAQPGVPNVANDPAASQAAAERAAELARTRAEALSRRGIDLSGGQRQPTAASSAVDNQQGAIDLVDGAPESRWPSMLERSRGSRDDPPPEADAGDEDDN